MTDDDVGGEVVMRFTQNALGEDIGNSLVDLCIIKLHMRVKKKSVMQQNILFNISHQLHH